jgi:hypothetical protein
LIPFPSKHLRFAERVRPIASSFQPKETVALSKADRQRQKAACGRFALTDLTATRSFALDGAQRHFALECFAKTRTGFVALERT